jgi:hypothetical protein
MIAPQRLKHNNKRIISKMARLFFFFPPERKRETERGKRKKLIRDF